MRKHYGLTCRQSLLILPAVLLLLGSVSLSASAGSLGGTVGGAVGGVGNTVGGATGAVGGAVGGATGAVGGAVGGAGSSVNNTVGGTLNGTKATVGALNTKGVLQAKARSDLIGGIKAKLDVMSKKNLAKLCVGIGGGSGCGSGNRHQLLGLIDARLELLRPKALLKLCVSVGGTGCGGGAAVVIGGGGGNPGGGGIPGGGGDPGGGGNPGGGTNSGDSGGPLLSSLSDGDQKKLKLNCRKVLQSPASYMHDMVSVCRLLQL